MHIVLSPRQVFLANLILILVLLCANIIGVIARVQFDHGRLYGFVPLFDFHSERNVPTFYSSIALLCSSALLFLIAYRSRLLSTPYLPWYLLSAIFLFLSIDEIGSIHERLSVPVRRAIHGSGLLYFAWIVPYGLALLALVLAYTRFLLALPRRTLFLFITAGTIFVLGAIGFEALSGRHAQWFGTDTGTYAILYTCEELLEMFGVAVFLYALLDYMAARFDFVSLTVASGDAPALQASQASRAEAGLPVPPAGSDAP